MSATEFSEPFVKGSCTKVLGYCRQFIDSCLLFVCFSETVLLRIMSILASAAATAHTRDTCATCIKYSSADAMHVSRHPGLKNPSLLL